MTIEAGKNARGGKSQDLPAEPGTAQQTDSTPQNPGSLTLANPTEFRNIEQALYVSEARFHTLFTSMSEGFALHEILCDEQGQPMDYRFLEVNPAFEKLIGFSREQVLGKTVREIMPEIEPVWIETYGRVAMTGKPANLEEFSGALNKYFEVYAYSPVRGQFAAIFMDVTAWKKAEKSLQENHAKLEMQVQQRTAELQDTMLSLADERKRFHEMLNALPAYVILLTADYHVSFANHYFEKRFGKSGGKRCYEYLFGRTEPCETCETYTVLKTGKPHHWEWNGPDGCIYDISDFLFTDIDGSKLILEMGIDITEQIQAQKALHATFRYARSLIEASLDPLVTINAEGKITDVNEATERVTGCRREQLVGTDFSDYFSEPQKAREGYEQVFSEGSVTDYPLTIRHRDGRRTDVLYNATIYKNEAGEVQGVFAAARDITAQKQAWQYARSLIEASLDPLVTINAEGKITDVNEATIQVTGVSRAQMIGTDFSDYFTEPQKAREGYEQVFAEGLATDYPLTIRHRDGQLTEVLYNAAVYKDHQGNPLGVFAAARDVTGRNRAERRQRVTNSLLGLYAQKTSRKEYLDSAVEVIREWSGCRNVGIRIKNELGNIPFESWVGFEKDFLDSENALERDHRKTLCRRIILPQPTRQDQQFLTPGGSFYCSDIPAFVKDLSVAQAKEYPSICAQHGFQSFALVPIVYGDEVFGVIQVTDPQKNMAPLLKVQFMEATIAPLLGEAVHRFNAESELERYRQHLEELVRQRTKELEQANTQLQEEIRQRQEAQESLAREQANLQSVFDIVNVGMILIDEKGCVRRMNHTISRWVGRNLSEGVNQQPGELVGCIHALTDAAGCGHTAHCAVCQIRGTFEAVLETGQPLHDVEMETDLLIGGSEIRLWLEISADPLILDGKRHVILALNNITDRKHAEQEVQRSSERYELLAQTAGELLRSPDPQQAIEILCRRVMEHLHCQVFFNFLVDEQEKRLHLNACAGIEPQRARQIEWLDYGVAVCGCVARDGCRIVAEHISRNQDPRTELIQSYGIQAYACHPLVDAGGEVIGTLSFGTRDRETFRQEDISLMKAVADHVAVAMTRMQEQQILQQSEARLKLAQVCAGAGIWDWDMGTGRLKWSDELFHLFGLDPQKTDVNIDTWKNVMHPDDVLLATQRLEKAIANHTPLTNEYRVVLPSGEIRWINALGNTTYDAGGQPLRMSGICLDITERKDMEQTLVASERKYRELIDTANSIIIRWDRQGIIHFINEHGARLLGYEAKELLGREASCLVPPSESNGVDIASLVQNILDHPERFGSNTNENLKKDGTRIWFAWTNRAITDEDGKVREILAVGNDITSLKIAEDALRESNEELSRFNRAAIGRELRMIELKKEINSLCELAGKPSRYALAFEKEN